MPEFLRKFYNQLSEIRHFKGGGTVFKSKRDDPRIWDENLAETISSKNQQRSTSQTLQIPKDVIPDGPIRFGSLGDGDAFIHKILEEKHIETKEQLYKISLRPTSFDAKEELRARPPQCGADQRDQQQPGLLFFIFKLEIHIDFLFILCVHND